MRLPRRTKVKLAVRAVVVLLAAAIAPAVAGVLVWLMGFSLLARVARRYGWSPLSTVRTGAVWAALPLVCLWLQSDWTARHYQLLLQREEPDYASLQHRCEAQLECSLLEVATWYPAARVEGSDELVCGCESIGAPRFPDYRSGRVVAYQDEVAPD